MPSMRRREDDCVERAGTYFTPRLGFQRRRGDVFQHRIKLLLKGRLIRGRRSSNLRLQARRLITVFEVGNQLQALNNGVDRGLRAILDLEKALENGGACDCWRKILQIVTLLSVQEDDNVRIIPGIRIAGRVQQTLTVFILVLGRVEC